MKTILACLVTALVVTGAMAGSEPIQLSLTPDIAVFNRSEQINGLTLSIWGENPQAGLALGFVNGSVGNSVGISLGLVLNYAENYKGVQWAPVNYTTGNFFGWQGGLVNYTGGTMKGLQTGVVNYSGRTTGLQFGFLNFAEDADAGVQLGVVNIIRSNTRWFTGLPDELAPGMILVNWRF